MSYRGGLNCERYKVAYKQIEIDECSRSNVESSTKKSAKERV